MIHFHRYDKPRVIEYVAKCNGDEIMEDDIRYKHLKMGKNGVNTHGIRKIKKCKICGKIKRLVLCGY